MKKIMLFAVISTAFLYGAENNQSLTLKIGGTEFCVTKGDIAQQQGSFNIVVMGRNQQRKLREPAFGDSMLVGEIKLGRLRYVPKDSDSASDDDTYKPFSTSAGTLWEKAKTIRARDITCWNIIEPRILFGCYKDTYGYFPEKKIMDSDISSNPPYFGEDAIKEAGKDLKMCYHKALQEGLDFLEDVVNKRIAFASLSTDVGFPHNRAASYAFKAITDFLMLRSGKYDRVELFVKKRSDLVLYKQLIDEYVVAQQQAKADQ